MMKIWENNGAEEIGLVTPTPVLGQLNYLLVRLLQIIWISGTPSLTHWPRGDLNKNLDK